MNKLVITISIFIFGLITIFLQGSLLRAVLPDFLIPNLVISLVVFIAFYENSPFGALLAFILGIEIDLYSGSPHLIGPSSGALVLVYGVTTSLSQRVYVESAFAVLIMSAISSVLYSLIYSLLVFEFNDSSVRYFSMSVSNAIVTGLVTPLVFRILNISKIIKRNAAHGGSQIYNGSKNTRYRAKNI